MCRVFVRHPCCSAADVFITRPRLESSSITHQGGNIQQAAVSESMLAGKARSALLVVLPRCVCIVRMWWVVMTAPVVEALLHIIIRRGSCILLFLLCRCSC